MLHVLLEIPKSFCVVVLIDSGLAKMPRSLSDREHRFVVIDNWCLACRLHLSLKLCFDCRVLNAKALF
jgi:hypothetical protein